MKFFDFSSLVSDYERLFKYLHDKGTSRRSIKCQTCGRRMGFQDLSDPIDGYSFKFARCNTRKPIRVGSFFEDFHAPLKVAATNAYPLSAEVFVKHTAKLLDISGGGHRFLESAARKEKQNSP
jgi:hypothetical protein